MYLVSIGSKSELKYCAISNALMRVGHDFDVRRQDVNSGVAAQPVGDEETRQGALNRARAAREKLPGSWGIGIENGILPQEGGWRDLAAVAVVSPEGEEHVVWSDAVEVPEYFVNIARERGFGLTTVGSVMAEMRGSAEDDPHSYLTAGVRSRTQILTDAAEKALRHAWGTPKKEGTMKSTHRIEIGGVVRELPVREVAPDVRVALFNILGDWELTEAAGKALAALIPPGIEALVMPDGKATALLHVMGRESGLPTFVARKEKKPYMALPVLTVQVKSITTDRLQTLYLGADDGSRLAGRRVAVVDDVISSGGTLIAMRDLLKLVAAPIGATMSIFTEGDRRSDVITLGHLPLF